MRQLSTHTHARAGYVPHVHHATTASRGWTRPLPLAPTNRQASPSPPPWTQRRRLHQWRQAQQLQRGEGCLQVVGAEHHATWHAGEQQRKTNM